MVMKIAKFYRIIKYKFDYKSRVEKSNEDNIK